jgi:hypothetical protein
MENDIAKIFTQPKLYGQNNGFISQNKYKNHSIPRHSIQNQSEKNYLSLPLKESDTQSNIESKRASMTTEL